MLVEMGLHLPRCTPCKHQSSPMSFKRLMVRGAVALMMLHYAHDIYIASNAS